MIYIVEIQREHVSHNNHVNYLTIKKGHHRVYLIFRPPNNKHWCFVMNTMTIQTNLFSENIRDSTITYDILIEQAQR